MEQDKLQLYKEHLEKSANEDGYSFVLESLIENFGADRGCLWLERENKFLYRGDEVLRKKFPFSRLAVDAVLREKGRSFLSFAPENDPRISSRDSLEINQRSCLAAACNDAEKNFLVVAYFDRDAKSGQFNHQNLKTLKSVLSLVPGAVPVE